MFKACLMRALKLCVTQITKLWSSTTAVTTSFFMVVMKHNRKVVLFHIVHNTILRLAAVICSSLSRALSSRERDASAPTKSSAFSSRDACTLTSVKVSTE